LFDSFPSGHIREKKSNKSNKMPCDISTKALRKPARNVFSLNTIQPHAQHINNNQNNIISHPYYSEDIMTNQQASPGRPPPEVQEDSFPIVSTIPICCLYNKLKFIENREILDISPEPENLHFPSSPYGVFWKARKISSLGSTIILGRGKRYIVVTPYVSPTISMTKKQSEENKEDQYFLFEKNMTKHFESQGRCGVYELIKLTNDGVPYFEIKYGNSFIIFLPNKNIDVPKYSADLDSPIECLFPQLYYHFVENGNQEAEHRKIISKCFCHLVEHKKFVLRQIISKSLEKNLKSFEKGLDIKHSELNPNSIIDHFFCNFKNKIKDYGMVFGLNNSIVRKQRNEENLSAIQEQIKILASNFLIQYNVHPIEKPHPVYKEVEDIIPKETVKEQMDALKRAPSYKQPNNNKKLRIRKLFFSEEVNQKDENIYVKAEIELTRRSENLTKNIRNLETKIRLFMSISEIVRTIQESNRLDINADTITWNRDLGSLASEIHRLKQDTNLMKRMLTSINEGRNILQQVNSFLPLLTTINESK
jgi:hypothetical protein